MIGVVQPATNRGRRATATPVTPATTVVTLDGSVERITFYNPQNGFTVLRLRVRGRREPVAVVGTLPAAQPGERLVLRGRWQTDPTHGAQFRPDSAEVHPPAGTEDLVRYLGSGLIHQLGPVLAERIVATFGDQTLAVLEAQPQRVREVPGIGPQRAQALVAAWQEHRALRAVTAYLSEHGLHTGFAPRLVRAYGAEAPRVLAANPYRLVAEVPGLGFRAADRLGRDLGVRPAAPARLQAAVHATLLHAADQGHTRLPHEALLAGAAELAGVAPNLVAPAMNQLVAGGVIFSRADLPDSRNTLVGVPPAAVSPLPPPDRRWPATRTHSNALPLPLFSAQPPAPTPRAAPPPTGPRGLRIYEPKVSYEAKPAEVADDLGLGLAGLVRAEERLAEQLALLSRRPSPLTAHDIDTWLQRHGASQELSAEQQAAVRAAATASCFVLTGGPGVGKTTTLRALVACLQSFGRTVALAAPTGKAAKRLSDVVGLEAATIHRLLGAGPDGFRHDARAPLPYDAVIVDEASMLDTSLARAVVAAIGPQTQLVLVGDADQLPSVGPGQVLRDLLASGAVPAATLATVFRQAAQSQIVQAAHRIRQGQSIDLAPATALLRGVDCVFVPAPAARAPEVAAAWAATRLPRLLDQQHARTGRASDFGLRTSDFGPGLGRPAAEVQVLAPLTRVTQAVNELLQAQLNPPRGQPERPHGALPLRTGDRVIQTHNNYALGVVNGDTGIITAVAEEEVRVDFGDGRVVAYAPADLLDLEHAYCLTVHRAQGSEWPGVVVLACSAYGPMLTRNLLYTALTRARTAAVIVGDPPAIERAIAETRDQARQTGLAALLRRHVNQVQGAKFNVQREGGYEVHGDFGIGREAGYG